MTAGISNAHYCDDTFKQTAILTMLVLVCACSVNKDINLHDQLRQPLLEAELGSAISIHFAKKPVIPLPPEEIERTLFQQLISFDAETRWSAADKLAYSLNKGAWKIGARDNASKLR